MTLDTPPEVAMPPAVDMSTDLAGLVLPSPVLTASGCAANGRELAPFVDLARIGAVVTKTVMLRPRSGRPTPRMAETPSGMLNSIGLQGPGFDALVETDLPDLAARGARVILSVAGGTVEEFAEVARRLNRIPAEMRPVAIEANISCPNVANRGQVFACDPRMSAEVVREVRRLMPRDMPLFVKLTPDVTNIVTIADACVRVGADGLTMINTLLGMAIDTTTMAPALAGVTGGLSGPAIRPVAVRCIWQVHQAMPRIPIIGVGGVMTGLDALEMLLAGASAVQVGTAVFHDPSALARVSDELAEALSERGLSGVSAAVGLAHGYAATGGVQ